MKNQCYKTLRLRDLTREIFLTFSEAFGVFEAHFLLKIFLKKKKCVVNELNKGTDIEQTDVQIKFSVMKPFHAS